MITSDFLKTMPQTTGVYIFKAANKPLYIGKALNIRQRVKTHITDSLSDKDRKIVQQSDTVEYIQVFSEVEALILEANLIKKYKPKLNVSLKDDKSFLYIVITKEEFPRILAARLNDRPAIKYKYGPFPSSKTVRGVLKLLRGMFPFCTQSPLVKRACFYSHIGFCNPCPGTIKKLNSSGYKLSKKIYFSNIFRIRKILEGKISLIHKDMEKNIHKLSEQQDFEAARGILRLLKQLEYITSPYYKVNNFLENTNFFHDSSVQRQSELLNALNIYFDKLSKITRIEGIDISNLSGLEASGSLVVFVNGEKKQNEYKRFKIKYPRTNDARMLSEVLNRRLKHKEWIYPDLFVIDGGKPQVSAAFKILSKYGKIPVVGIAKREELLVIPYNDRLITVKLKADSGALRLVQEVRDESHRFANNYHAKLRSRFLSFDRIG